MMNADYNEFVARMCHDFNMDSANFISYISYYALNAIEDMEMVDVYKNVIVKGNVPKNGYFNIPEEIDRIDTIYGDGVRLVRSLTPTTLRDPSNQIRGWYEIEGNSTIRVAPGTSTIEILGYTLSKSTVQIETPLGTVVTFFPNINRDYKVIRAVELFIMRSLIERGYKHPIFSYDSRDPNTNIYEAYKIAKRIAVNYITKSNPNMRNTVHKVFSSLIVSHLNFK